jgi:hypothetical protein
MHFDVVRFMRFAARASLEFRCCCVSALAAAAASGAAAASVVVCVLLEAAAALFSAASCLRACFAIAFSNFSFWASSSVS